MSWEHQNLVLDTLRNLPIRPTLIIEGGARGADQIAKVIAIYMGIPVQEFPADWKTYGKKAGAIRNQQMLDQNPDLVIAFHPDTGITAGTRDMAMKARAKGTDLLFVMYKEEP